MSRAARAEERRQRPPIRWPTFDASQLSAPDRRSAEASGALGKYTSGNPVKRLVSRRHVRVLLEYLIDLRLSDASVVDIGCGDSFVGSALLMNASSVGRFVGLDPSESALRIAEALYRQNSVRVPSLVRGSIHALPFGDDAFDVCLCSEVLEHVHNVETALEELRRVTRGYALLSVPNDFFFRLANLSRGAYVTRLGNTPGHVQHFSRRSFLRRIRPFFDVVSVSVPVGLWIVVLARPREPTRSQGSEG